MSKAKAAAEEKVALAKRDSDAAVPDAADAISTDAAVSIPNMTMMTSRHGRQKWTPRFKTNYRDEKRRPDYVTEQLPKTLRDSLAEQYTCYVLITCESPSDNGEMNVELSYEGDAALASYMIEGAQSMMENLHE